MVPLEYIKEELVEQIMASKNEELLKAIYNIFTSTREKPAVTLSPQQIEALLQSEKDIENGKLISEEELAKSDTEWLK